MIALWRAHETSSVTINEYRTRSFSVEGLLSDSGLVWGVPSDDSVQWCQ